MLYLYGLVMVKMNKEQDESVLFTILIIFGGENVD